MNISDSNGIQTHNHLVRKRTLNNLAKLTSLSLSFWVLVHELSGCGFESHCCHLNFRYDACLEQGVLWQTIECRLTRELIRDMIITCRHTEFSLKCHKKKPYKCSSWKCDLCLAEKVAITRFEGVGLLKKRNELLSNCQHRNKFIKQQ